MTTREEKAYKKRLIFWGCVYLFVFLVGRMFYTAYRNDQTMPNTPCDNHVPGYSWKYMWDGGETSLVCTDQPSNIQ